MKELYDINDIYVLINTMHHFLISFRTDIKIEFVYVHEYVYVCSILYDHILLTIYQFYQLYIIFI